MIHPLFLCPAVILCENDSACYDRFSSCSVGYYRSRAVCRRCRQHSDHRQVPGWKRGDFRQMNSKIQEMCDRIAQNREIVKKITFGEMELVRSAAASFITLSGKDADPERLKECKALLRK